MTTEAELAANIRRYENLKTFLWITIGIVVLIVLAVELVLLAQNGRLAQQIADCQTPGGECYERERERDAAAVESILQDQARNAAPSLYNVELTEANTANIAAICEHLRLDCIDPPLRAEP